MSSVVSRVVKFSRSKRAEALAEVLEQGAEALASFASGLTVEEWGRRGEKDQRPVGVVVHHVATMYPLEIQLAQTLARGEAVTGVTWDDVHAMNAAHAKDFDEVTKEETLDLLEKQQRGGRGGGPGAERRGAFGLRPDLDVFRRSAHVPVHARGSRGAALLAPPRGHPEGPEAVTSPGNGCLASLSS